MIWWRPPVKYRAWWDTELARKYGADGLAARLWLKHFYPHPVAVFANDRDRIWRW